MLGASETGKTTLMTRYITNKFADDGFLTIGANNMERTIRLKNANVVLSIWDLGGQSEYLDFMPIVYEGVRVFLVMFDLTRKTSLTAVRDWYKPARRVNKGALPILVGTKFDLYDGKSISFKEQLTKQAKRFSEAMNAPLIYCSSR